MDVVNPIPMNLWLGWTSMIAGALSGSGIGLFFHNEAWLGGYGSFRRRMLRLGHISFFGLGILNVLYALSLHDYPISPAYGRLASTGFVIGALSMPTCCFLTAWKVGFRHLFPIPVLGVIAGIVGLLGGWFLG